MNTKDSIYHQHEENTEWISKLNFYKDEIRILSGRLEEIANKNNSKDTLAQVERFQNQFVVQRNNLDEVLHNVKINEDFLQQEININPTAADHKKADYHNNEKQQVVSFEKTFIDLKDNFNDFAAKWL